MNMEEALAYAAELRDDADGDTPREGHMADVIVALATELERLRAIERRARNAADPTCPCGGCGACVASDILGEQP